MSELERIQKIGKVTGRLNQWKGLHTAISGVGVIVLTFTMLLYPSWLATVLGIAGLVLALWLAKRYYEATLGAVSQPPGEQKFHLLSVALGSMFAALFIIVDRFLALALVAATIMALGAFTGGVFRGYYLGAAVLTLAVGVFVFATGSDPAALLITGGMALIVTGLLDHLNLVKLLKSVPEDDHGAAA